MCKYKIKVLLSSYNGEAFIDKQIQSILNQKGVEIAILIRDDGSTDKTPSILSQYAKKSCVEVVYGENVGFKRSFSSLVKLAASDNYVYDFYAFADQDDLWYPNKLLEECRSLSVFDSNKPNVVVCNSDIIDENGIPSRLFRNFDPLYTNYNVYFSTDFQGCSMVFNRCALEKYNLFHKTDYCHDNWLFLTCAILGNVTNINKPLFGYRIHSHNAIGVCHDSTIISRIKKSIRYWFSSNKLVRREIVQLLFEHWNQDIDKDRYVFIYHYLNYRKNLYSKFWLMFNLHSFRMGDGTYRPFTFWRNLLFNKY